MNIQGCQFGSRSAAESHPDVFPRQRGVALTIALIVLVVLTILGLSSMRSSTMQEKLADSFDAHQVAAQSAEGGVTAGEGLLHDVFIAACLEQTSPIAECLDGQTMNMQSFDECFANSSNCADGLCATSDGKDWASWNETIWSTTGKYRELNSVADLSSVQWDVSPIAGLQPRFLLRSLGRLPCDPSQPEALRTGSRDDDKRMITSTEGLGGFDVLSYYYEVVSRYGNFDGSGQNVADAVLKSVYAVPDPR